jgi:hypothetical protein
MNETRRADPVVRLLTMVVILLGMLVLGLGIGTFVALREVAQVRAALGNASGGNVASLQQTLEELTRRQEALASALGARADQSQKSLDALKAKRRALAGVDKGPIDKLEQLIQLNQLLADEMLLLLDHVAASQESLANAMKPLPAQRALVSPEEPATGGAGASGTGDAKGPEAGQREDRGPKQTK